VEKIVLDTNILIEILKNNAKVVAFLGESDTSFAISSISTMELYYGAKDKKELQKLKKFTSFFEVIELDKPISSRATSLIEKYAKSHTLNIPDALIAATVLEYGFALWTLNRKDFHYIDDIKLVDI
jgi:tRNA(fMet)-specific endonuclease VapC